MDVGISPGTPRGVVELSPSLCQRIDIRRFLPGFDHDLTQSPAPTGAQEQ
jgi:hypothetical protein